MSTLKNSLIGLLLVTTVGGAALAWHQYQELVELRGAALTASDRADLQKKIWDLQKKNRELQDKLTAAEARGESAPELAGDAPNRPDQPRPQAGPPNGRWRGPFGALQQIAATPEGAALLNSVAKAQVDSHYASLFRSLNLTPDQADKLSALLVERQNAMRDVFGAAREQGINPRTDPEGFSKLVADAQAPINDSIRSLIGDAGVSQLQNFDQTMPQRGIVNLLQQRLSSTDAPLTTSQADQLVQILASNSPQRSNSNPNFRGFGGMMDMGGTMALASPASPKITNEAVAQAGSVLNNQQVTALQQLQQQQKDAQQLRNMMRNAGQPPAPAPAAKGGG